MKITAEMLQIFEIGNMFRPKWSLKQRTNPFLLFIYRFRIRNGKRLHNSFTEVIIGDQDKKMIMVGHQAVSDKPTKRW